jgi:hypothetical protein
MYITISNFIANKLLIFIDEIINDLKMTLKETIRNKNEKI